MPSMYSLDCSFVLDSVLKVPPFPAYMEQRAAAARRRRPGSDPNGVIAAAASTGQFRHSARRFQSRPATTQKTAVGRSNGPPDLQRVPDDRERFH